MKKYLLFMLVITAICCAGCKKDSTPNNGAPVTTGSFMPVTTGSTWAYVYNESDINDTVTVTMNASNTTLNGKTYYTANAISKQSGTVGIYFYEKDHVFAMRSFNYYANAILELQLYNDTATVNNSWISYPTDNGSIGNIPVREISTIEEKGETKLFGGQTFTNVEHTEVDIQYDLGAGYETKYIYDYYLAKGIGILGYNLRALNDFIESEGILKYTIK